MGSGSNKAGQREPHAWLGTPVRTRWKVDTGALLHPLHHTGWVGLSGVGFFENGHDTHVCILTDVPVAPAP